VLFSSTLILTNQFDVSDSTAPAYLIPWAVANFAGALLLRRLFDTVGRKVMIGGCYAASAAGLHRGAAVGGGGAMTDREQRRRRASPSVWSPAPMAAPRSEDRHIEGEVEAIVQALREHGPLGVRELRRRVESRFGDRAASAPRSPARGGPGA
jgi:hypothetical protein